MFLSRSRKIYDTFLKKCMKNPKLLCANNNNCNAAFESFHTSPNYLGQVSFKLSDIGEGIREVVLKEWFVKVGDKVSQFDEICEVQSDKASVTITSRYDGTIRKIHYRIDDIALVGKPLIDIEIEGDDQVIQGSQVELNEETSGVPTQEKHVENVAELKKHETTDALCIPSVRRLAKEHRVDLNRIKGSGKDGRILKEDVLKYLHLSNDEELRSKPSPSKPVSDLDRTEPIKGFQRAMVKTMTESLKIPHLGYSDEISVTKLSKMRKTIKSQSQGENLKLSFMPFFIKAASNALQRYPVLNSTLDEKCENITYKREHNIGVAMDTKVGLAVPVIKNVSNLSIIEINNELNRLIKSGRDGTFTPQDLAGGTFTISNIGAIGGTYVKPVIMPPQVAIIALGKAQKLPRFDLDNNIVAEELITMSGAADHRIVDGATMGRFAEFLKNQIENPYLLFLNV